jgi:hypothetical protein
MVGTEDHQKRGKGALGLSGRGNCRNVPLEAFTRSVICGLLLP